MKYKLIFLSADKLDNIINRKMSLLAVAMLFIFAPSMSENYSIYPKENTALKIANTDQITLLLTKQKEKTDTISIVLSTFIGNDTGEEITLSFIIKEDTTNSQFHQFNGGAITTLKSQKTTQIDNLIIDKSIVTIQLIIPEFPSYQTYKGTLILSRFQEKIQSFDLLINAEPSQNAELVVDLESSTQKYTNPIFGGKDGPTFIWHLHEKSRKEKIKGVHAILQDYTGSNGKYYPKEDMRFTFNQDSIDDFWAINPNNAANRTVQIGEFAEVIAHVSHLPAGEYTSKIKFSAVNLKTNIEDQIATISFTIKGHWFWAAFWLTIAIIFSFLTNKWINTRRQKTALSVKISQLNPTWLKMEPPSLGVIKARSTLKLVEDLTRRFFISGSDIIGQKIESVEVLLKYLDRCRNLRNKIESSGLGEFQYNRIKKKYEDINKKIGRDDIDEDLGKAIEADLEKLEQWFQPGQFDTCYAEDLQKDIINQEKEIGEAKEIPKEHKKKFNTILTALKNAPSGTIEQEKLYSVVKVLWERRYKPEFLDKLIKSYNRHQSVNLLFNEVDEIEWERLKEIKNKLEFISPQINPIEKFRTFRPIWFKVATKNPKDTDNYLFKHGLNYDWEITITRSKNALESLLEKISIFKSESNPPQLKSVTNEPRVVQFIPRKSEIQFKVTLRFVNCRNEEDKFVISADKLKILPSTIFATHKAFRNVEWFAVIAAWVVAGISGILTFYYKNDSFGSISDYLTLFLWGAGVDQTKNFIQNYQVFTSKNDAAST